MSDVKTYLMEYLSMGGKFNYKKHKEIPKVLIKVIEDYGIDYTDVPVGIINDILNDIMEDIMTEQNLVNGVDVDGRREQITQYLREGTITVGFTKKDGEDRRMNCTLVNIPSDMQPKGETPERKGTALAVFDVDKQGWRSFNLENVFELKVGDNYIFQTVGK